jgi:hypothetical protein
MNHADIKPSGQIDFDQRTVTDFVGKGIVG